MSNGRRILGAVFLGIGALVYGISPVDVIPDVFVPIGFADDFAVIGSAAVVIVKLLRGRKPDEGGAVSPPNISS